MKELFENAEMTIVAFAEEDILTTSGENGVTGEITEIYDNLGEEEME